MPSQIFKITRAPEAKPITAERLRSLLWRNPDGEDSDWEVKEMGSQQVEWETKFWDLDRAWSKRYAELKHSNEAVTERNGGVET